MFKTLFAQTRVPSITPQQAKKRLASADPVILLDVRTAEEYAEIHIPNSISLPLDRLKQKIDAVAPDKDAEIVVYCLSGARSATACGQLAAMGYTNVSNLGGIHSWPYETERGRGNGSW